MHAAWQTEMVERVGVGQEITDCPQDQGQEALSVAHGGQLTCEVGAEPVKIPARPTDTNSLLIVSFTQLLLGFRTG